jgi:hypothetical protein
MGVCMAWMSWCVRSGWKWPAIATGIALLLATHAVHSTHLRSCIHKRSLYLASCRVCSWTTCFLTVVIGAVTISAKGDMNPHVWGEQEALKQLKEEGLI